MSKDDLMDMMLGAAVVALGYALYRHHKAAKGATSGPPITGIPAAPEVYTDANGNYFFDMNRLFEGVL